MRRALANGDMSGRMTKGSDGWRGCAVMKELGRLEGRMEKGRIVRIVWLW
jgi:hypothetical protein